MQPHSRFPLSRVVLCFALSTVLGVAAAPAFAGSSKVNVTSLLPIGAQASLGNNVRGDLVRATDGNFYAAASAGGTNQYGSIIQFTPAGVGTEIHALAGPSSEGSSPYAGLYQASDGMLYGTTYVGGDRNLGTVFKVSLSGDSFTNIFSFTNASQGGFLPYAGLVQDPVSTDLFGTTLRGGPNDAGTVYRLTLAGSLTTVASFDGSNGKNPEGRLAVGPDGALYGTTLIGGANDRGTVFRVASNGTLTTIFSFPALGAFNAKGVAVNDVGANPRAGLLLGMDGNFYGTAYQGGQYGYGTVFRLTPAGAITVLHSFGGPTEDGSFPLGGVSQMPDGSLVGTTEQGGAVGGGAAWRIDPNGNYTLLHSFSSFTIDGRQPYTTLLPANGYLYGISFTDATVAGGVFFRLELPTNGALPVTLTASPETITVGGTTTLTWSSPTAATCTTAGGTDGTGWADPVATSGTLTLKPPTAGIFNYLLSCTDGAGVTRSTSAQVTVNTPALQPVDGGGDGSGGGAFELLGLGVLAGTLAYSLLRKHFPKDVA